MSASRTRAAGVLAVVAAPLALAGCLGVETTQDKSAEKAKVAGKRLATEHGLSITRANPDVRVEGTDVVQDANGVAAVVRLRNTGPTQVTLPVAIAVQDAKGKRLYANDVPGLEPALVSMPLLRKGQEAFWVNNQILVAGKAQTVDVQVGDPRGRAPADVPQITTSGLRTGRDADGAFVKGTVRNASAILQKRLTIFCVAREGEHVRAAGRAVVEKLPPAAGAKKPTHFTAYFIGDPKGAHTECSAPPTVLAGGPAK